MTKAIEVLRQEIASCSRMLVDAGILNYSGHISVRIPGTLTILIQRVHDVRADLEPERLLVVDLDGQVIDGHGKAPGEVFIHTEIYRARLDAGAVGHFHHDPTTVFSLLESYPLVPVKNHACRWMDGVPIHYDSSQILTPAQGRQVVATMSSHFGLLLRGHGEVIIAEDVPALYADVVHFVENAQTLSLASQIGTVTPLSKKELEPFAATFKRAQHAEKLWKYYTAVAANRGLIPRDWVLDQDATTAN